MTEAPDPIRPTPPYVPSRPLRARSASSPDLEAAPGPQSGVGGGLPAAGKRGFVPSGGPITTVRVTPGRGYVIGLAIFTLFSAGLVVALVMVVARGRIIAPMMVPWIPLALLIVILWYQVLRPTTLRLDDLVITQTRPLAPTTTDAWIDVDSLTVVPWGRAELETGPVTVTWRSAGKTRKQVVTAEHTPVVLAALRRHAPEEFLELLR